MNSQINKYIKKENLTHELSIAKKAAIKAGAMLKENRANNKKVIFSSSKDLKLDVDIEAENIIKDIILNNSSLPILAEESGMTDSVMGEIYWVVDPLDGTANYHRDIPISCVAIALMNKLEPILGVIYDFNNNELYEGSVNTKAYLNEKEIFVSNTKKSNEGILLTGLPNDTDYSDNALMEMVKNFQEWRKIRMIGSAAIASIYVASGKADLYIEKKSYLWDVAAGAAIINAAGGEAIISNLNEKFQVDVHFSNSEIEI